MLSAEDRAKAIVGAAAALAAKSGDTALRKAFCDAIATTVQDSLLPWARRVCGFYLRQELPQIVEETLNEVFRKAIRLCETGKLDTTRDPRALSNFFRKVARNELLDQIMRESRRRARGPAFLLLPEALVAASPLAPVEIPEDVRAALGKLVADDRAIIEWRVSQDLSYPEIAARLGITPNAAKVRCHRALKRLRNELTHP
jgi:RNA polymerase sigma-70 factor (ECF subfamily)